MQPIDPKSTQGSSPVNEPDHPVFGLTRPKPEVPAEILKVSNALVRSADDIASDLDALLDVPPALAEEAPAAEQVIIRQEVAIRSAGTGLAPRGEPDASLLAELVLADEPQPPVRPETPPAPEPETPAVPVAPVPVTPAPVPPAPKPAEATPAPGGNKPPDGPSYNTPPERPDEPKKHWQKLVAEAAAKNPPRPTSRWGVAVAAVVIVLLVGALFYLFISNSSLQQQLTASEKQVEQLTKQNQGLTDEVDKAKTLANQQAALIGLYKQYFPALLAEKNSLADAYAKLKADNAGWLTGFNAANQEIADLKAKLAAAKKAKPTVATPAKKPKGKKAVATENFTIPACNEAGKSCYSVPITVSQ